MHLITDHRPDVEAPKGYRRLRLGEVITEKCIVRHGYNQTWAIPSSASIGRKVYVGHFPFAVPFNGRKSCI